MSKNRLNILTALVLIGLVVCLRILPHPANFAPVAAVAIFGGAVLPRRLAVWTPVAAMMLSDLVIGLHNLILITWGCYALIALASAHWLRKPSFLRGLGLTISGSLFFFFVTNFAVWLWSGMYVHSWAGLSQCYIMALPFLRGTFLGDLVFTAALFGVYALATSYGERSLKGRFSNSLD